MVRFASGMSALLIMAAGLVAQQDRHASPDAQYRALFNEYNQARSAYYAAARKATSAEEKRKIARDLYPKAQDYAGRFLAIAKANPGHDAAVDALIWVTSNARYGKEAGEALEILTGRHIRNPKIRSACVNAGYLQSATAEAFLRAAAEKSPDEKVRAQAWLSLGLQLKGKLRTLETIRNDPSRASSLERYYGKAPFERLLARDPKEVAGEMEACFERVIRSYGRVDGGSFAKQADRELFERRDLAIGSVAPEIEGEDVDGRRFKLSDYRGKVVVLDFWGDW